MCIYTITDCVTPVYRLLLQLRLSSYVIAVIGLIMSIVGTLLMGDWQAIRHDPCTDASLFHHPELLHTYTFQLDETAHTTVGFGTTGNETTISSNASIKCEQLNLSISLQQHLKNAMIDLYVYPNVVSSNEIPSVPSVEVGSCPPCSVYTSDVYSASSTCMDLHINSEKHCLEVAPPLQLQHQLQNVPMSSWSTQTSWFTYCLSTDALNNTAQFLDLPMASDIAEVHLQSVQIVEAHVNMLASRYCEYHLGGNQCHWNPLSSITHRHCDDCPPICRKYTNYINFYQLCIAAFILLASVPVTRIPITSLVSDIIAAEDLVCVCI